MTNAADRSRRDFLRSTGLAAGLAFAARTPGEARAIEQPPTPDAVLDSLLEGNRRFMSGQTSLLTRRRPEDFAALAGGQAPKAIIVACADSRVAPELVFDQGIGDLFVVRAAGNLVSGAGPIIQGSLEFAAAELGARLILVIGHSQCGAVKAAIEHIDAEDALPGAIGPMVDLIKPAVRDADGQPGDRLENVIRANVRRCVERIKRLDPILSKLAASGELKVAGATYELATGKVDVFA